VFYFFEIIGDWSLAFSLSKYILKALLCKAFKIYLSLSKIALQSKTANR
jgi:hypothetical protein